MNTELNKDVEYKLLKNKLEMLVIDEEERERREKFQKAISDNKNYIAQMVQDNIREQLEIIMFSKTYFFLIR